ncbi:MAG: hypothetical protein PWP38_2593 [Clostridiales bacterium]|nr:hypothetical protein [Clostridiales bacterium]
MPPPKLLINYNTVFMPTQILPYPDEKKLD